MKQAVWEKDSMLNHCMRGSELNDGKEWGGGWVRMNKLKECSEWVSEEDWTREREKEIDVKKKLLRNNSVNQGDRIS